MLATIAPSFMAPKCSFRITFTSPVTVTKKSPIRAACAIGMTRYPSMTASSARRGSTSTMTTFAPMPWARIATPRPHQPYPQMTKVAPARFASLLMGSWLLANAAANKIAGALAAYTPTPGEVRPVEAGGFGGFIQRVSETNLGFYSIFVVSSFVAAAVMLLFVPLLKRLTSSIRA